MKKKGFIASQKGGDKTTRVAEKKLAGKSERSLVKTSFNKRSFANEEATHL
jgi:hypothetical protein